MTDYCQTDRDADTGLKKSPSYSIAGNQYLTGHPAIGKTITALKFTLSTDASPTVTAYGRVYRDESLVTTIGTLDTSTITSSWAEYTLSGDDTHVLEADDDVVIELRGDEKVMLGRYDSNDDSTTKLQFIAHQDGQSWDYTDSKSSTMCLVTGAVTGSGTLLPPPPAMVRL